MSEPGRDKSLQPGEVVTATKANNNFMEIYTQYDL